MAYGRRSSRTTPLPKDWATIRRRILRRDDHTCTWADRGQRCGQPATDVDHIGDPNDHSDGNLRALCSPHHRKRSASQGGTAAAARRIPRNRPQGKHPGLLR
jgi:5-methylcytosine-specific restriction endonuclease McrA